MLSRFPVSMIAASLQQFYKVDSDRLLFGEVLSDDAIHIILDLDIVNIRSLSSEWRFNGELHAPHRASPLIQEIGSFLMPEDKEVDDHSPVRSMIVEADILDWEDGVAVFDVNAHKPRPQRPADPDKFNFYSLYEEINKPIF